MPAYLTHKAAGERVLENLKAAIPNSKAFYLGCQGPDLLFFRNYQPWRKSKDSLFLGSAMHKMKTRELLQHAFNYLKDYDKDDKDELISYMAGFLVHYATDKNAHPFVYGKVGSNTSLHNATEHMWDSFVAKEQWGIEADEYDPIPEVMYGEVGKGICGWYSAAARDVYGSKLKEKAIKQAQQHLAKAKQAFRNIRMPHRALIRVIKKFWGFDAMTMIYPKERNESLFSGEEYKGMQGMIQKGVEEALSMTAFMLEYISGKVSEIPLWFGERNFAGEILK
jgi:hypothetical protein